MFFIQLLAAVFSYVMAKSIWDFVKVRATAQNQYPIVWLVQTTGLLLALLALAAIPVAAIGFYVYLLCTRS